MNKLIITLLLIFSNICFSQATLQTGFVKYTTSFEAEEYTKFNAFLNFNDKESLFTKNKLGMDSIANLGSIAYGEKGIILPEPSMIVSGPTHTEKGFNYYRNFETKKIIFNINKFGPLAPYVVNDEWIEIKWMVLDDFKEIAGHTAQKATANFRGTDFEVWFATDLPFPYGPINLFGLPGVILEVWYNDQKQITAYEVCYPCENIYGVEPPTEPIVKTMKEHVHIEDNFEYYLYTELNKNLDNGMSVKLREMPTEKKILEKRNRHYEKIYEWENKKTKRLVPAKELRKVVAPKKNNIPINSLPDRPEPINYPQF